MKECVVGLIGDVVFRIDGSVAERDFVFISGDVVDYGGTGARGSAIPTRWLGRCVVVSWISGEWFLGEIGGFVFNASFYGEFAGYVGLVMVGNVDYAYVEYGFVGVAGG